MDLPIPSATNLSLFVSATLVLLLVPGPAVLYIFARSVEQVALRGSFQSLASIRPRLYMSPPL